MRRFFFFYLSIAIPIVGGVLTLLGLATFDFVTRNWGGILAAIAAIMLLLYYAPTLWQWGQARWQQRHAAQQPPAQQPPIQQPRGQNPFAEILVRLARLTGATLATVAYVIIGSLLLFVPGFGMVLAAGVGFIAFLFVLPFIPGAIDSLTNKPNRRRPKEEPGREITTRDYRKSTGGFFTYLQPNQVKMIERGGTFIRAIMDRDGSKWKGEKPNNSLTPDQVDYWTVEASENFGDSHPIPFPGDKASWAWVLYSPLSILFWLWKREVYRITGGIFTGIPGFQNVRTYPFERFKKFTHGNGKIDLNRIEDYSDHYRVGDFQYPVRIPEADTKDKVPVQVLLNEVARVVNPFKTAYNTDDDWTTRFLASISDSTTTFTRPRPLEQVLSAKSEAEAREFSTEVTRSVNDSVADFGLLVTRTQVLDITAVELPKGSTRAQLAALALARVVRDADKQLAKGKAAYIVEAGKALQTYPEAAVIPQVEGMVRTAEVAGDRALIILGGGQTLDPGQAAMLQELRRLRPPSPPSTSTGGEP